MVSIHKGTLGHVAHGVIAAGSKRPLPQRLQRIYLGIDELIRTYRPDGVAVEAIFHARNARSSLILGHARGVVLLAAANGGVAVHEYSALAVKQALTGYGHADKAQLGYMVQRLLGIDNLSSVDASDALAVAICHAHAFRTMNKLQEPS